MPSTDEPYAPLVRALRPELAALPDADLSSIMGSATDELLRLMPELDARLGSRDDGNQHLTTVPERRQARLLEGILGVLGRLGERRPILLVIEDLHRADAGTRTLATFLARIARAQRVAIVGTYQADAIRRDDPWAVDLRSLEGAPRQPDRLTLGPLGRDDLARLIESIEGEPPSASVLVVVVERSGGRPLVAEELLAARRELPTVSLTSTFEDLVLARMAVRSIETRRVLRLLAPAGRPLSRATVAAVAEAFEVDATSGPPRSSSGPRQGDGVLDADLAAGLEEALAHGFAIENEDGVFLRHELVGRAVEADLLPSARIRHHAALARARRGPAVHGDAPLPDRARCAGGRPGRHRGGGSGRSRRLARPTSWPPWSWRSPRRERPGRPGDLERPAVPRPGPRPPKASDPTDLAIRAAEAAFAADRPVRAAAYLDATIGAADARQDRTRLGLIYDRLGQFRRVSGDAEGAVAARRRAVELVPTTPSIARAAVVAGLAQLRMLEGTFSVAEKLARDAIRIARACEPPAAIWELHATTTLGVSLGWRADPDAAVAMLTDARRMAETLGDLDELFRVYANLTTVLDLAGPARGGGGRRLRGHRRGSLGRAGGGLRQLPARQRRGFAVPARALGGGPVTEHDRARMAAGRGQLPQHARLARDRRDRAVRRRVGRAAAGSDAARARGRARCPAGRPAAPGGRLLRPLARRPGRRPARRRPRLDARARDRGLDPRRSNGGDGDRGRGRVGGRGPREARPCRPWRVPANAPAMSSSRPRPSFGATASTRRSGHAASPMRGWRPRVPTAAGSTVDDDPETWRAVGDAWAALKIPYEIARARWREAEARLASGAGRAGRADARKPLLDAVDIALSLGAIPLVRELRELAGRALIVLPPQVDDLVGTSPEDGSRDRAPVAVGPGAAPAPTNGTEPSALVLGVAGSPEAPTKRDTFGLSGREREVLMQIARGRTNREIGERLFISEKTVGVHVGKILSKLRVSGRVEAATVAIRLGLTERN